MYRATIINLFGAPGAGKSTGAAYVFSKLKMLGVNAELITEFAKDKCFEESKAVFENQVYIFGKQYFRTSRVADKVDVIVTDSPLFLSCIYNPYEGEMKQALDNLVMTAVSEFNCKTYYVHRTKAYNPIGRFQDEAGSDKKGKEILEFLEKNELQFKEICGNEDGYNSILHEYFNEKNKDVQLC